MAGAAQALLNTMMIPSNSSLFNPSPVRLFNLSQRKQPRRLFSVRASSDDSDCNEEECAPDKEVGKVSVEWLAGDKTKVAGTFPPRRRGWTGYTSKDTAGQTNIYSVEPTVYVAETAISSGTAGSSADGAENTAAIVAGLALISVAVASSVLLQVDKNQPQVQTLKYSGPALSYYIGKFTPAEIVEASAPSLLAPEPTTPAALGDESPGPEVVQVQAASVAQPEDST
ncbi:hypothetical protein SAY86_000149 [Trapa natans]|uniref:Protein MAINTENANCE OF PSII UNDER HIGH LIGHT 1 n=1 Tax=Trapa natans TaxID=22666 RepID=A0AAN7RL50_TRANT|nr:hypothetical protein SAY86_000149 [Trapa natans]